MAHMQPHPVAGLSITLEDGNADASAIWSIAGWTLQFVHIPADGQVDIDLGKGKTYVKIITGSLANLDRPRFAGFKTARDIEVHQDSLVAGPEGALLAIMTATSAVPENIHAMSDLTVTGPHANLFVFTQMDQTEIGKHFDFFKGVDAHLMPGFHLLEQDGTEIVYVHLWTAGKGVDMSPHDHSQPPSEAAPAFTETHFVLNNGTGKGAMYDCTENTPSHSNRKHISILRGQEHGPFWVIDDQGMPKRRENGSVEFNFHGWQAGDDDLEGQAYDLVAAFELNPDYSKI